ncbi:hypothetical protein NECAME_17778, partial [Necator americanus]
LGLEQFEYSNETSGLRYGCSSPDENKKNKKLLHANKKDGLDEKFNRFTPPVTLSRDEAGLSTIFSVTDIWRSYFAQKLLHIIGENIAFYPANAIQVRNSHDFLKDFRSERYEFPPLMSADEYTIPPDENFRGVNCRRVEMEFLSERVNLNEVSMKAPY